MAEEINKIRKLEKQFVPEKVTLIREIQTDVSSLKFKGGVGRYYAKELIFSLEAGLLLASLHLSSSLLELFVRDLLINDYSLNLLKRNVYYKKLHEMEKQYEDGNKPQWTFFKMTEELYKRKIIKKREADDIKGFYKKIRIPILHGLSRRFVRNYEDDFFEEIFGRMTRDHRLEELIEDQALILIKTAASFMKKHAF